MLTTDEKLRYSRQTLLSQIGESGQLALAKAKVLIVGVGGLGTPASLYLASAGVGKLYLVDGDNIELSNLPRQILFTESDINENKAEAAAEQLRQHNSHIDIEAIDEMLDDELCDYYFPEVDIILDCSDNMTTRYLVNKMAIKHQKTLVIGAATGFDGQCLVVNPEQAGAPCYECLFPQYVDGKVQSAPAENCQTIGILGPVLAIIGGMQALQAIKLIVGLPVNVQQLNLFDGLSNQWQQFNLTKQANCSTCQA